MRYTSHSRWIAHKHRFGLWLPPPRGMFCPQAAGSSPPFLTCSSSLSLWVFSSVHSHFDILGGSSFLGHHLDIDLVSCVLIIAPSRRVSFDNKQPVLYCCVASVFDQWSQPRAEWPQTTRRSRKVWFLLENDTSIRRFNWFLLTLLAFLAFCWVYIESFFKRANHFQWKTHCWHDNKKTAPSTCFNNKKQNIKEKIDITFSQCEI